MHGIAGERWGGELLLLQRPFPTFPATLPLGEGARIGVAGQLPGDLESKAAETRWGFGGLRALFSGLGHGPLLKTDPEGLCPPPSPLTDSQFDSIWPPG